MLPNVGRCERRHCDYLIMNNEQFGKAEGRRAVKWSRSNFHYLSICNSNSPIN